jgi:hypothetical protein
VGPAHGAPHPGRGRVFRPLARKGHTACPRATEDHP